ncbi:hypothetical protein [Aureibacter tunicatorum]|nr:hypothetical protein [Aureibacter tunicatorum]
METEVSEKDEQELNSQLSKFLIQLNTKVDSCAYFLIGESRDEYAKQFGYDNIEWLSFNRYKCKEFLPEIAITAYLYLTYNSFKENEITIEFKNLNSFQSFKKIAQVNFNRSDLGLDKIFSELYLFVNQNFCENEVVLNLNKTYQHLAFEEYYSAHEQLDNDFTNYLKTKYFFKDSVSRYSFSKNMKPLETILSLYDNHDFNRNNDTVSNQKFANDLAYITYMYSLVSINTGHLQAANESNNVLKKICNRGKVYEGHYYSLNLILNCLTSEIGTDSIEEIFNEFVSKKDLFDERFFYTYRIVVMNSKEGSLYEKQLQDLVMLFEKYN